uniref:Uncharacterized protein n=1 Tax=Oryza punctata TaxID=4537 RepID=A0A0E0JRM0_ORYPU
MEYGGLLAPSETCAGSGSPDGRGGWRAARFLIAVGFLERIGFNGVQGNLVMYLTGPMGMSTAAAAAGANAWGGTVLVLTLVGALAADSRLGRYRAIVAAGVLHLLSLGMLTISSVMQPTHPHPVSCHDAAAACLPPPPPSLTRLVFFHAALYLLALAQGFHNPCSEAFGADQFAPPSDPGARASRSSYFNWYNFSNSCGYAISNTAMSYVEDNVSWTVGFAACFATTAVYLPVFLLGTPAYRAEQPVDGAPAPLARLAKNLGMLTISSVMQPTHPHPVSCHDAAAACLPPPPPSLTRLVFFHAALYLLALAQGFHNPCSEAFGADQFAPPSDPGARASRSSYFNWYNFSNSCGYAISNTAMSYVEDNVSWTVGFAACFATTAVYLPVFLLGTPAYRAEQPVDGAPAPLARLAKKSLSAARAWTARVFPRKDAICTERLLAKEEVEDGKGFVVKLLPIWATSIVFAAVISQQITLFTKQGSTMDRRIAVGGGVFVLPPAALQDVISVTMLTVLPVYDRALVPLARRFTGHPAGITTLQRVGAGMATCCLHMVVAALVEAKRLRAASDAGLLDRPDATVPMSVWWLVPQYALVGLSKVFGVIGLQEFFYDQVPDDLRSVGLAMSLSAQGVGSYASGVLVSAIDWATTRGGESWFSDDLNRAHLDYYYWLLAALAALEVAVFVYIAKRYSGRLLAHSDEPSAASKPGDGCGRGGWRAALFIIAVGFLERIGFYGVQGNLIMYLAGPMGMSMAAAAAAANAWGGMVMVLTLVGALAADSHLGRYRALVAAGVLYLLSLGMLTVSSTLQPTHPHPASCNDGATACSPPPSPTARLALFHAALYLLALAQGFHKPCSEAFGADQFAATTTPARTRRGAPTSTGFTSPHPGATGYAVATTLLSYAEDNVSWTVRFDVCWATMVVYLAVFLLGTATYRAEPIDGAPLARLAETSARGCARVDEEGILPEGCHLHRTVSTRHARTNANCNLRVASNFS